MDILHLTATFGRLEHQELTLSPGLNVLYAPNETGKSTWGAFIRTMLYGLSTRERGPLADKNRFAPWSGAAMQGRMDVSAAEGAYTLLRDTKRASSPMGEFSCTYTGTATPVAGITAQNAGEALLGVPREVFERSAFIGQNALAVDQDAELERRIAALITTGEEDTSYSQSYERLKKQLNRRKHNKTGLIPALEREIDDLQLSLRDLDALEAQARQAQSVLDELEQQAAALRQQAASWQALEQQSRAAEYAKAAQNADEAARRAALLEESAAGLPDGQGLALLEGQAAALQEDLSGLAQQRREAEQARQTAESAREALAAHPLYPADETALRQRADAIAPEKAPTVLLPIFTAGIIVIAGMLAFLFRADPLPFWIFTAMAVLGIVTTTAAVTLRRRAIAERQKFAESQRAKLEAQIAEYLPLREQEARLQAEARRLDDAAADSCRRRLAGLLAQVRTFEPAVTDLSGAQIALASVRRRLTELTAARQQAREAALYRDALQKQLPDRPVAAAAMPSVPALSKEDVDTELARVQARLTAERSRLDTLTGQIRSLDRSSDLQDQLAQKREQLSSLQAEYDAITLAMDALTQANTTLQNRFSPALGARAAEIFSAITAGRYDKVLLSRDFSLSAEMAGDPVGRSIRLLSQGAADQLYLAVRLAICDMVLPAEKRVPLILDDALVSFDDDRLRAALDYLLAESEKRQILLFTCQKREMDYLSGRKNVTIACL
ncbi:MAG: hypothetical protein BHW35_05705 [Firmicutes bacterium CAG:176_63_11]|nr:MAG: hypothetical protein BHW35_05705 [Firmicutes bacterium CAG:176_63_11]